MYAGAVTRALSSAGFCAAVCAAIAVCSSGPFADGQAAQTHDARDLLISVQVDRDFELSADPHSSIWASLPHVELDRAFNGDPLPGIPTTVRSRWTPAALYLLYVNPYETLTLRPELDLTRETPQLWNWDVAEAFIGMDIGPASVYKEFQVSPRGEWVDLGIDRDNRTTQPGLSWNSGFAVAAAINTSRREWYGEMRIPFAAIDSRPPRPGLELRLGLFRLSGHEPRTLHFWRPTATPSFHLPQAFGRLRLAASALPPSL